uniref:SLC41A family transporter n=1 Tax=Indiicoccus explosivorum TaxID=1917864 RepID=UPI001186A88A
MILTQLLLILLFIALLLIVTAIIVGVAAARERTGPPVPTEFDAAVKGLIAILIVTAVLGIVAPFVILWNGMSGLVLVVVIAMALAASFTVGVAGVALILLSAFRNKRQEEAAEQWGRDENRRLLKKLKLNTLHRKLNNYYLDNSLFGLPADKSADPGFIYDYCRSFLTFFESMSAELEATDIRLLERFQREFAQEFEVCTYLMRYERVKLDRFYASVMEYYPIFRDPLAERVLQPEGAGTERAEELGEHGGFGESAEEKEEHQTYSSLQVLWVLEAHLSEKMPVFMDEVQRVIKEL